MTPNTTWQTQFVWDNRDANQPTSASAYRGTLPSFNVTSNLLRHGLLARRQSTTFAAGFYNYEHINSRSANLMPGGAATLGGATQTVVGSHLNTGFHLREEITLAERWTLVAGFGGESTRLSALANNFTYPVGGTPTISPVPANRTFFNVAPEVGVQFSPDHAWRIHARLGTGYGTPQAAQLFTNAQGPRAGYFKKVRQVTGTLVARQDWTTIRASELADRVTMNANSLNTMDEMPGMEHSGHMGHMMHHMSGSDAYAPVDRLVPVAQTLHLAAPVEIMPAMKAGGMWTIKSDSQNRTLCDVLQADPDTGKIVSRQNFAQRLFLDKMVGIRVAAHEGQLFGLLNQLLGLMTAMGLVLLSVSAVVLWWRRRHVGMLGAPIPTQAPRWTFPLIASDLSFPALAP